MVVIAQGPLLIIIKGVKMLRVPYSTKETHYPRSADSLAGVLCTLEVRRNSEARALKVPTFTPRSAAMSFHGSPLSFRLMARGMISRGNFRGRPPFGPADVSTSA